MIPTQGNDALVLLLDTNFFWLPKEKRDSLQGLCRSGRIKAYIPALVVAERVRQLTQKEHENSAKGETVVFGRSIRSFFLLIEQFAFDTEQKVTPFAFEDARVLGEIWHEWLTEQSPENWRKKPGQPLKLKEDTFAYLKWVEHKADWLIAAMARRSGYLIVTNDKGPPFQQSGVKRVTVVDVLKMINND